LQIDVNGAVGLSIGKRVDAGAAVEYLAPAAGMNRIIARAGGDAVAGGIAWQDIDGGTLVGIAEGEFLLGQALANAERY
jgi:hypothetical protein